jgi:transcriptional regulator with PAS, ATPase and Fis domain
MNILLEFTPFAQYAIGMDHKIISWNQSCEFLTGFSEKEMIGTDKQWMPFYSHQRPVLADLIVDRKYETIPIYYKSKCKKSTIVPNAWEATDRFDNCGGKSKHLYWWAVPIFDNNEMFGAVTTLQDVTEQNYWELLIEKETNLLVNDNIQLKSSIKDRFRFGNIIGNSEPMQKIYQDILKSSRSTANIIIYGESGTGKESVARAIHETSDRSRKEFVPVNCGAIPENIIESEFFGYVKGAFTGANCDKNGFLDSANNSTLFLDEVGEISINMQVKLLRALESGEYTPVGSSKLKKSNFRIISATNKDLMQLVKEGSIREDFYYRLHVIPINIPPLRDRKDDLPLLIDHFVKKFGFNNASLLPGKLIEAFFSYNWPGNIRELQNVIQRCLIMKQYDFFKNIRNSTKINEDSNSYEFQYENKTLKSALQDYEKKYITTILETTKWKKKLAAKTLGISRKTLYRKIVDYGLN